MPRIEILSDELLTAEEKLVLARYALRAAERTLRGDYPWILNNPKFTQREAREACLGVVRQTLARIQPEPSNYVIWRDVEES